MKHFQFWVITVFLGLFNLTMNAQQASRINGTIVDENLFPIENANIILAPVRPMRLLSKLDICIPLYPPRIGF